MGLWTLGILRPTLGLWKAPVHQVISMRPTLGLWTLLSTQSREPLHPVMRTSPPSHENLSTQSREPLQPQRPLRLSRHQSERTVGREAPCQPERVGRPSTSPPIRRHSTSPPRRHVSQEESGGQVRHVHQEESGGLVLAPPPLSCPSSPPPSCASPTYVSLGPGARPSEYVTSLTRQAPDLLSMSLTRSSGAGPSEYVTHSLVSLCPGAGPS